MSGINVCFVLLQQFYDKGESMWESGELYLTYICHHKLKHYKTVWKQDSIQILHKVINIDEHEDLSTPVNECYQSGLLVQLEETIASKIRLGEKIHKS